MKLLQTICPTKIRRRNNMERINKVKFVLWIIVGVASAVAITRFMFGLGATTNLTDNTPWGFWIGFDVMGGVALAGGGFVLASFNYIFRKHAFHPVTRAAILTAFLGYVAVAVGLLFDLGLPWNIWHAIIYWNPHSPLFEVAWCVMLYLTVLFMEFIPVVLEKYPRIPLLKKIHDALVKVKIPLVILGIMLSTLHQSSLGSLFLAMPYRLHPLWYTPIIPIFFFVSAIGLGLMMVMVESSVSHYFYKKNPETTILKKLSKAAIWIMAIYGISRFIDVIVRGADVFLFDGGVAMWLFWIEMSMTVFIPLIIFSISKLRESNTWLFGGAMIGVMGVVFNRLNVGGLTHLNNLGEMGSFYFPSWMELAVSAGVVAAAMLIFFFFVENYKVWEKPPKDEDEDIKAKFRFSGNRTYYGTSRIANRTRLSLAFVISFGIGFAVISGDEIYSEGFESIPTSKARGGDTLFVDGNKDGYGVAFKHAFHTDSLKFACGTCHHMNLPDDQASGCFECHNEMYYWGDAFKHDWHASKMGANLKCFDCHPDGEYKNMENAKSCDACHDDMQAIGSRVQVKQYTRIASYVDAMHKMCIDCHEEYLAADPALRERNPNIALCMTCHPGGEVYIYTKGPNRERPVNKWVVLPSRGSQ
jgi:Ni/Fe-hydrogenase subunit HybB-like protein